MDFKTFLNESVKTLKSFADIKTQFVGVPLGHHVEFNGVSLVLNGTKGKKYGIDVYTDGEVSDADGNNYKVHAGDKIYVDSDGLNLEIKEDSREYPPFDDIKAELKHLIDNMKMDYLKSRKDFIDNVTTCGELVSNKLPMSRSKWK